MKKTGAIILVVLSMVPLFSLSTSLERVVYFEGFDEMQAGDNPAGWTVTTASQPHVIVTNEQVSSGTQALRVTDHQTTNYEPRAAVELPEVLDGIPFTFSFDWYITDHQTTAADSFYIGLGTAWNLRRFSVNFVYNGGNQYTVIERRVDGESSSQRLIFIEFGVTPRNAWGSYTMTVKPNPDNLAQSTAWILIKNGEASAQYTDVAFDYSEALNWFSFGYSALNSPNIYYLDNIRITTPPTATLLTVR